MRIALVGLPSSGKSTCFQALTGIASHDSGSEHLGMVNVPDHRIDRLVEIHASRRVVYPEIAVVDTVSIDPDEPAVQVEKQLATLAREAEALVMVLQCFGDLSPRGETLDPAGDLEAFLMALTMADLTVIERHLERSLTSPKRERNLFETNLLERLRDHLQEGGLLFQLDLSSEEDKLIRGDNLITMKPLLVACNLGDGDLAGEKAAPARQLAQQRDLPTLQLCATLEAEIAQLPEEDQQAFLEDYGLQAPVRARLIRAAYELLGQITFLTAAEREARGWTVRSGSTAAEAAGKIHTDIQQGFIRAEVVAMTDLDRCGSMAECRKQGLVRLEGRDYVVQDGDVMDMRFSR